MSSYNYKDLDGDRLKIEQANRTANTAFVVAYEGAYLPSVEAPKAAQAILDAAGVQAVILTDLPKVLKTRSGNYVAGDFTSYHQSSLSVMEKELKAVTAIWLQRKADEADKLAQQIEEAETFRANQARIDANKAEKKALEAKKAHDDLRTSPIALKALALYNRGCVGRGPYKTWDDTNLGKGSPDDLVNSYIRRVEEAEAKEKEAAEKLAARRDELAKELCDGTSIGPWYEGMGTVHKRAIDRIIELEDKAA